MKQFLELSYLYPSLATVIILILVGLVIYTFGRLLAWTFRDTEKKVDPEQGIMTEVDLLRKELEEAKADYKVAKAGWNLWKERYDNLLSEFEAYKKTAEESVSHKRLLRIDEVEKQLTKLQLDYDVVNTDRDELKQYATQLEQRIEDDKELYDSMIDEHNATVDELKHNRKALWHSRREVAKLNRDLISAAMQIAELGDNYSTAERKRGEYEALYSSVLTDYAELKVKMNAIEQAKPAPESEPKAEPKADVSDLRWAKWVATDMGGLVYAFSNKPEKLNKTWYEGSDNGIQAEITSDQALAICGRIPEWSDEEPTQVTSQDISQIYIATDRDGMIYAYKNKPKRDVAYWYDEASDTRILVAYDVCLKLLGKILTWHDEPAVFADATELLKLTSKQIGWVAADIDKKVYLYEAKPCRSTNKNVWLISSGKVLDIIYTNEIEPKIGFVPTWQDDPIPVTVD